MKILSKSLSSLGALLLAHACYSAHEHSSQPLSRSLRTSSPPSAPSPSSMSSASSSAAAAVAAAAAATAPLPLDIILETLLSVVLFCLGLVLGSPALQPLRWRVWAGKIEREGGTEDVVGASGPVPVVNPFASLEARVGFWDVRAKRREFDEWVREKGAQVPS